jgi:hypothetical protein
MLLVRNSHKTVRCAPTSIEKQATASALLHRQPKTPSYSYLRRNTRETVFWHGCKGSYFDLMAPYRDDLMHG